MRSTIILVLMAQAGLADVVVPVQTLRSGSIISGSDLKLVEGEIAGAVRDPNTIVGMEARVVLYAGRHIRPEDISPPAVVQRNQIVPLVFQQSGLRISTGGRALDRGAVGDTIRVMNISSRKTLFGRILADGSVDVSGL